MRTVKISVLKLELMKMKKEHVGNLLLGLFGIMAVGVIFRAQWVQNLDVIGQQWLTLTPTESLTSLFLIISRIGNHVTLLAVTVVIFVILWLSKKGLLAIWFAGTMAFSGTAVPFILKHLFARSRPIGGLFTRTGYSFPSGHSTGATVFYGLLITLALLFLKKKWQKALVTVSLSGIVLLVLWSRVYLGFHFSTDVLASLFLGSGQVLGSVALYHELEESGVQVPNFTTHSA